MLDGLWGEFNSRMLELCGGSERLMFAVTFAMASIGTFYFFNITFTLFQFFGLFQDQRIPRPPRIKAESPELIRKALLHVNLALFAAPVAMYLFLYDVYKWRGMEMQAPLPPIATLVYHLLVSIAVEDTLFYWGHRLFHHPSIYKYIHKQHHQFHASIGIAALYAHPVEEVLANFVPTYLGCLVSGAPLSFLVLWTFLRLWETVEAHSGFDFAWSPWNLFLSVQGGAERHDFHHFQNKGSYGSFTKFWDWVCGTDDAYNKWRAEKRPDLLAARRQAAAAAGN